MSSRIQEIIEGHQGKIWAEQGEMGGAEFHFLIPVSQKKKGVT